MNLSYIITPLAGGVIGYVTNWLAIKMLFRPYNQVKIGKVKVPFTPGLLPKERYVLSKKIGETVDKYLVSKDTMLETINSPETNQKINTFIQNFYNEIIEKDYTINDLVNLSFKNKKDKIVESIKNEFLNLIVDILNNEENIEKIGNMINEYMDKYLNKYDNGRIKIIYKSQISPFIEEKSKELLLSDKVKNTIHTKLPEILLNVENLPVNHPDIDKQLHDFVVGIIEENVGKLAMMFVNPENVYASIKEKLFEYLKEAENQDFIYEKIIKGYDYLVNNNLSELINVLDNEINKNDKLDLDFLLNKIDNSYRENLTNSIKVQYLEKVKPLLIGKCSDLFDIGLSKIFEVRLNKILDFIGTKNISKLFASITNNLPELINKVSSTILNEISMSEIVEENINNLDLKTSEEILLSVVKKELNSITIVGAILGFFIGFVPMIVDFFSK